MATVYGMERNDAEFICFLDGNDLCERSKLTTMVRRFRADANLAFLTHDLPYIDSIGDPLYRRSRPGAVMSAVPIDSHSAAIRDGILMHGDFVWLGSAFAVRRSLGGDLDGFCEFVKRVPDPCNTYQNWPLAYWVACHDQVSLGYVDEKRFHYRLHGANYSGDSTSVEKALRNTMRAFNTTSAVLEMARLCRHDQSVLDVTTAKVEYCQYQVDILGGRRWAAARGFVRGLTFIWQHMRLLIK